MANLYDPFADDSRPQQAPPPPENDIGRQLQSFMGEPSVRAALLQTGLALMQPVGIGQTPMGHFAQSVGQGTEAYGRNLETDEDDQKKKLQTDLLQARVDSTRALADKRRSGGSGRKVSGGLSLKDTIRLQRQERADFDKFVQQRTGDPNSPFFGKSLDDPDTRMKARELYDTYRKQSKVPSESDLGPVIRRADGAGFRQDKKTGRWYQVGNAPAADTAAEEEE